MSRHQDGPGHRNRTPVSTIVAGGLGLGALAYAAYVAMTWFRYGRAHRRADGLGTDDLLDRFMPQYEVVERHQIEVAAPAPLTYAAARAMDINRSLLVRSIFAIRTLSSRVRGQAKHEESRSLVDETLALGWRILAEVPNRALVMGAVTQPWQPAPVFRGLSPEEFASFAEPGYVKILWTLEAESLGASRSRFRTETRVCTSDPTARGRFRRYWALFSPGILIIRRASLRLVKSEAERRLRAAGLRAASPASRPSGG